MFPPCPHELAHHYCVKLISRLDSGTALLCRTGRESEERKNQGLMVGSLVCYDKVAGRRTILYAVSGNGRNLILNKRGDLTGGDQDGQWEINRNLFEQEVVVPSIVSPEEIEKALAEYDKEIHRLTDLINKIPKNNKTDINCSDNEKRNLLINKRRELTDISLQRVFDLYNFTRFDGKTISLNEIIKKHGGRRPPTGTGDCCGPKLLSYAFAHGLQPISMDEVYYGSDTKTKINKHSYDPCDDRCGYILPDILVLEILYRDNDIIVVNKESGLLSVPGRGIDKIDSVETRIRMLFPETIKQPAVHRLDMETSGVLVLAFNKDAHRELNRQFAEGAVGKKYVALLDGILRGVPQGQVELKTRLDVENRPYQIVDNENGKLGITTWKKLGVKDYKEPGTGAVRKVTVVEFTPITGRTHQLRLASSDCACDGGLGLPIVGDSLYGKKNDGERLMLHSFYIEFYHPTSGKKMIIETAFPF